MKCHTSVDNSEHFIASVIWSPKETHRFLTATFLTFGSTQQWLRQTRNSFKGMLKAQNEKEEKQIPVRTIQWSCRIQAAFGASSITTSQADQLYKNKSPVVGLLNLSPSAQASEFNKSVNFPLFTVSPLQCLVKSSLPHTKAMLPTHPSRVISPRPYSMASHSITAVKRMPPSGSIVY